MALRTRSISLIVLQMVYTRLGAGCSPASLASIWASSLTTCSRPWSSAWPPVAGAATGVANGGTTSRL
eukprot:1965172-Rhodomonas_salina.1